MSARTGANRVNRKAIGKKSIRETSIKPERRGKKKIKTKQRHMIKMMR